MAGMRLPPGVSEGERRRIEGGMNGPAKNSGLAGGLAPFTTTGGGAPAPYVSSTTDAQRLALGGSTDWGKTTAQMTGSEPTRTFFGELKAGQSDGEGGIPSGATPSFNPASGKVEWMVVGGSGGGGSAAPASTGGGGSSPSMAGLISSGGNGPSGGGDYGSFGGDTGGGASTGGGPGPGGAKVVDPASGVPSMQGLQAAGDAGGGSGANMIAGPTHFRQNIGARMIPDQNSALAGLRRIY